MYKIEVMDYTKKSGEVRIFMGEAYGKESIMCDRNERPNRNIELGYKCGELVTVIVRVDGVD